MTVDIRDFIAARLDEDEQVARSAGSGAHWLIGRSTGRGRIIASDLADEVALASPSACHHIARWDPARVLADVAAKRRIVERHASYDFPFNPDDGPGDYAWSPSCDHCHQQWPCPDLRDLAASYADHRDFDPAWRLGAP